MKNLILSDTKSEELNKIGPSVNYAQSELKVYYNNQPNNVIFYTSTDGNIVTPWDTTAFIGTDGTTQLNIISNTYSNGIGIIVFNGDIGIIGSQAFNDCSSLQSVSIPHSVTSIANYAFAGCSGLTSVIIPESVTSIGNYVFRGCSGLTSVSIPESVTSIGDLAFDGCSGLTSVSIPGSVTSIGDHAFIGCSNITTLIISMTTPPSFTSCFSNSTVYKHIYVPSNLVDTYKAADGWKTYASIIEAISK